MGVTIAVTRVQADTSNATQDITTTDLGGLTPKAVLLIATRATADGTAVDGAGFYMGASDGLDEWGQGYEDQHAQATTNVEDQDAGITLPIFDGTATNTFDGRASISGFITNGARFTWLDSPSSGFLITAIFFAGSDLSVDVGEKDLGGTADALLAVTDVGFEADVLIVTLHEGTSTLNGTVGFGFVHNDRAGTVTQRSATIISRDSFGTTQLYEQYRDGEGFVRLLANNGALDFNGVFQSFDSSGFDIQLGGGRSPAGSAVAWVALRFGSSPVVNSKVYTYSTPTATGSHTDSNPGFEPQFVMYVANRAAAADTTESDADAGTYGVVMVDADDLYTQSISSEDAAADSNTQSLSDNQINLPTHTGGTGHQATLTSFGSTGPVWNYSATDSTARLWPALAIEVFTGGGATDLTVADAHCTSQVDAVTLTQVHNLVVADASCTTQVDPVTVERVYNLSIDDAHVTTQVDPVSLTQLHNLTIDDASCTTQTDAVSIAQLHNLTANDAHVTTQVDPIAVSQAHTLAIADASCTTQVDPVTLTQLHVLSIDDAHSTTQVDPVVIAQTHVLAVGDAYVTTQVDAVSIESAGTFLSIADSYVTTQADAVTLTQLHVLVVGDSYVTTQVDVIPSPTPPSDEGGQIAAILAAQRRRFLLRDDEEILIL